MAITLQYYNYESGPHLFHIYFFLFPDKYTSCLFSFHKSLSYSRSCAVKLCVRVCKDVIVARPGHRRSTAGPEVFRFDRKTRTRWCYIPPLSDSTKT